MFGIKKIKSPDFSSFYKERKDCFGNQLPEWGITSEIEEMMDIKSVLECHKEANKCLDEKVRNGMEIKDRGYKLLTILVSIFVALFGLSGFFFTYTENVCLRFFYTTILFVGIVWIFRIIYFLFKNLLLSVDYWHSGESPDYFINKQLLAWCTENNKSRSKHLLCYELNRIQDKIYFNQSENKRRLIVINTILYNLAYFAIGFTFFVLLYLGVRIYIS